MKKVKLFAMILCLLVALFLMVSCGKEGSHTDENPSVTPGITDNEDPTTQVTPTTPGEKEENLMAISTATLSFDGKLIFLDYANGATQVLDAEIPVRDGYNGAYLSNLSFDEETKLLTVTFSNTVRRNHALVILNEEMPEDITVSLRGNDGALEYQDENGEWKSLCTIDAGRMDGTMPFASLLEVFEFGKQSEGDLGKGTVLNIADGNDGTGHGVYMLFRAREWMNEGYDIVTETRLFGSFNFNFMTKRMLEMPSSAPYETTSGSYFKDMADDIASIRLNNTYIGANHGYNIVSAIPNVTYLTEEDIGSVWQKGGQKYVLVKVTYDATYGEELAWFCPFDDNSMNTGVFTVANIAQGEILTHVSGATVTDDIVASKNSVLLQLRTATNHLKQHVFLNGTVEIDPEKIGVYESEYIDVYETYDVIYLPAMLNFLMENVGYNTNDSTCDEAIEESYVTFITTYRFHKNGSCVIYNDYVMRNNVLVTEVPVTLCSGADFGNPQYIYLPGTIKYNVPTQQGKGNSSNDTSIYWNKNDLLDKNVPTSSYFHMTDADATRAMNLGFYPLYGDALPYKRFSQSGSSIPFGWINYTMKVYPQIICRSSSDPLRMKDGDKISNIAYRIPSVRIDPDLTVVNWYWVGDEIILSLHTDKAIEKVYDQLPEYMNGMKIGIMEGNRDFVSSEKIEDGKISIKSEGPAYAILKLTPAE